MIAPLAWTDLYPTLVIVTPLTLAMALFMAHRGHGRTTPKTVYSALFTFLKFWSLFLICGVAQALYFHGAISLGMEISIIALAAVCSASSAISMRIDTMQKTETNEPL